MLYGTQKITIIFNSSIRAQTSKIKKMKTKFENDKRNFCQIFKKVEVDTSKEITSEL